MKNINNISTNAPENIKKSDAKKELKKLNMQLFPLQNLFYAEGKHALLIILQGMDTSGKDGTIRHVFSCINPQGCRVNSFKTPTEEEKRHDFLWRVYPEFPEKGMFEIFNRSYYEDILFPVVHDLIDKKEVAERHKLINEVEEHLQKNGTIILKFFLHISEKEQKSKIEQRLADPEKKWKYTANDSAEAKKWNDYVSAYQQMIDGCGKHNPFVIVPADQKWYRNYLIATTMVETLEELKMKFPKKFFNNKTTNMTDITINIKTGSENSEPKVTATTDNAKAIVPKTESPKDESPKDESPKKDDPKKMDMPEDEHVKMGSDKTKPSEEAAPKQEAPKEEMKEEKPSDKDDAKKMDMTEEEHAKMGDKK